LTDEPSARTLQFTDSVIDDHFANELNNVWGYDSFGLAADYTLVDALNHLPMEVFTQTLTFEPNGRPAEEFVGIPNADKFLSAMQRNYGKYRAQVITANMRQSMVPNSPTLYNATIPDSSRLTCQNSQRSALR
jgi:hypothetical protein